MSWRETGLVDDQFAGLEGAAAKSRRRWVVAIGLLLVAVAFVVALALRSGDHRRDVKVATAVVTGADDGTLTFTVPTCHGAPAATVTETATEVHVRMVSDTSSSDKCGDEVQAHLRAPLGARSVIDDTTGAPVAVRQVEPSNLYVPFFDR